jgi:hypothetical protein
MTPQEALQILSDATEPQNANAISRSGYVTIQQAIETLAKAIIPKPSEANDSND